MDAAVRRRAVSVSELRAHLSEWIDRAARLRIPSAKSAAELRGRVYFLSWATRNEAGRRRGRELDP
jgi:hypothetical protein